jgi:plasmid stabilization system protein ParE
MKSFLLTSEAIRDLNQIWDYLVEDNFEAANRVLAGIEKTFSKLAKSPGIGHFREDLTDKPLKFFLVYSYLIVYRFETKPLEIVRVLHVSRDIETLLNIALE